MLAVGLVGLRWLGAEAEVQLEPEPMVTENKTSLRPHSFSPSPSLIPSYPRVKGRETSWATL